LIFLITDLLEKARVISQQPIERSYHICYQSMSGSVSGLKGLSIQHSRQLLKCDTDFSLFFLKPNSKIHSCPTTSMTTTSSLREFHDSRSQWRIETTPCNIFLEIPNQWVYHTLIIQFIACGIPCNRLPSGCWTSLLLKLSTKLHPLSSTFVNSSSSNRVEKNRLRLMSPLYVNHNLWFSIEELFIDHKINIYIVH